MTTKTPTAKELDFGGAIITKEPPIDGAVLLDSLVSFIRRFVVLSEAQGSVIALWTLFTWALDSFDFAPYLNITSAEKRSGKSRVLEVLSALTPRAWLTGRVSAAVLTRKVDAECPVLALDESDAAFKGPQEYSEALRAILNSGFARSGRASLCVGTGSAITYKDFSTFCPKVIAGIGELPDTVRDRAIPIRLQRKLRDEKVERFRLREIEDEAAELRVLAQGWAETRIESLRAARPELPSELNDRQQDVTEPLLACADAASLEWGERARKALVELCTGAEAEDGSVLTRLLADIQAIFTDSGADSLPSKTLCERLAQNEAAPWSEWGKSGKPLTPNGLARLLKPLNVTPRTIRVGDETAKGYRIADFTDSFLRYVACNTASQPSQPSQCSKDAGPSHFFKPSQESLVTVAKSASNPHEHCIVTPVTVQNPKYEQERQNTNGKDGQATRICEVHGQVPDVFWWPDGRCAYCHPEPSRDGPYGPYD